MMQDVLRIETCLVCTYAYFFKGSLIIFFIFPKLQQEGRPYEWKSQNVIDKL